MSFWKKAGGFLKKAVGVASVVPGPWTPIARTAGTVMSVADALKRRRSGGGGEAASGGAGQDLGSRYNEAMSAEQLGPTGPGYQGLLQQDIGAAYGKYMDGATNRYRDIIRRESDELRDASAAAGRLDTGFYDEDVGEMHRGIAAEFANEASRASLQTAGMETDRLRSVAGLDQQSRDRYLDLMVGGLDRAQAESNAKRAERASTRSAVIGVVGDVAGAVISDQLRKRRRAPAATATYGEPPMTQ